MLLKDKLVDISIDLLKKHFKWIFEQRAKKPKGLKKLLLKLDVVLFIVQDWITNIILVLEYGKTGGPFELVTGRLKRYKADIEKYPLGSKERDLADELCAWANKFDPNHC